MLSIEDGERRFSEIKRTVGDITQRVLTENLRSLERDGYLTRRVGGGSPVAVFYELTPLGESFIDIYKPVVMWATQSLDAVKLARRSYDEKANDT